MGADEHQDWQQQLEQERYEMNVQALGRCLAAGAKKEDVELLARECGVNPKHINVGESRAQN